MVSREEARQIALQTLKTLGPQWDGWTIWDVFTLEEIDEEGCRRPRLELTHLGDDPWIVYLRRPEPRLESSTIIIVCRQTGRVKYFGTAWDEG